MAGILHVVGTRASHDVYNRTGDIYPSQNYDSYSQLVSYSPKQGDTTIISAPVPPDTAVDPTDSFLNPPNPRAVSAYPNFASPNRSSYYNGTPPALYPSSSLTSAPHMGTSGTYNYPYPFPNHLPIFDGSAAYSPSYLTQNEVNLSGKRPKPGMSNESNKNSKRKVSRSFS